MAAIRRRGRKWHTQIRRKGHPALTRSFDSRREANAWAREEETRLERIQAWKSPVSMHRLVLADLPPCLVPGVTLDYWRHMASGE
jgi:hypothetical protein